MHNSIHPHSMRGLLRALLEAVGHQRNMHHIWLAQEKGASTNSHAYKSADVPVMENSMQDISYVQINNILYIVG